MAICHLEKMYFILEGTATERFEIVTFIQDSFLRFIRDVYVLLSYISFYLF